jgi:hypothetical protein
VISDYEFENGVYDFIDGDDWVEREEEYIQAIGFLALMAGCKPHEVFDDPDWPKTLLWDLKCSNSVFKIVIDVLKGRM